jgi:hypothetical protein
MAAAAAAAGMAAAELWVDGCCCAFVTSPCYVTVTLPGAEQLKDKLAQLGLKCGGTVRQRAERLYALRGRR